MSFRDHHGVEIRSVQSGMMSRGLSPKFLVGHPGREASIAGLWGFQTHCTPLLKGSPEDADMEPATDGGLARTRPQLRAVWQSVLAIYWAPR